MAKMQVAAFEARQQSREKEVEALRRQVLDYQARKHNGLTHQSHITPCHSYWYQPLFTVLPVTQSQSDERALIAKLHQHLVALQLSESAAVGKLEVATTRIQQLEAYKLRAEQKLDAGERSLYHARQAGQNRVRYLRQIIQSLRRQFAGALPLAHQEKFSQTMMNLQDDQEKVQKEKRLAVDERREAEGKVQELEVKLRGLEELISTLKDVKGAQKVWEFSTTVLLSAV